MPAMIVLLAACSTNKEEKFVRSVKLVQPVALGNVSYKSLSGTVKESREISLGFKTGGQIEKILVKEGDFVRQGQTIAILDQKDYKLGVDTYQIQYDQMKKEVDRMKQLYEAKSLNGNDYEKAVAGLEQVRVQLQINKNKLEYTTLQAPVSGYIQTVNYEKAEMVQAGSPIVNLLDVSKIEVEVDIPASLYMQQEKFSGFSCASSLSPNVSYPLTLISINQKASSTQLYKMLLSLTDSHITKLTAGMNVVVNISLTDGQPDAKGFTLPVNSIFNEQEKSYVWVLGNDSTVSKLEIKLQGIDASGKVIITEGIQGNEQIIKAGVHSLTENEKVHVLPESDKTNVGGLF
ncbi:efflux RND transporter periplasmic adaptor subunit [Bacteroides sp.]|uniref:efflux RND transporter periplasmic adaptor subunit n=1 Tax=Bacteroides sp. TaxID=29523 RepID=UPI0026346303|nr:efflux RND transporter periplasmic adaptor subunit [Bacteroides sp.]MDD3039147.1 efflux RND transporter periplasmic adaptor subunit [Bacteroides sp.]